MVLRSLSTPCCHTYQGGAVVIVGEGVLGVVVVLEQVEDELEDLRRADPVRVPQLCHRPGNLLLQEVALEAGEVVLLDHVAGGEGAEHLLEHDEHGGRPLPVGGHGVGDHREAMRRLTSAKCT